MTSSSMTTDLSDTLLDWYAVHARDLPWRRPGTTPWAVLVSEVMLQQTPVTRVVPAYQSWLERWPSAPALAADPAGEAIRQWGTLGYPRRALRLHAAAVQISEGHGGELPRTYDELLALPGVGTYTAAAVASFAFGQRHAVLDTNVRRVLARAVSGTAAPASSGVTTAERENAERLLPTAPSVAARYAAAIMELGALVCTARTPRCTDCPLVLSCVWRERGQPPGTAGRTQSYEGTDRQARGRLLAVLRHAHGSVSAAELDGTWPDAIQRARALASLLADGLVIQRHDGRLHLPG
jgi:A/G-specific adenine glycosylase